MVSSYSCSDYCLFYRNTHWSLELLLKCCTLCQMRLLRFYNEHCFLVSTICTWSLVLTCHQGILERLDAGEVIIGDGSYVNTLEKRGYVKVENWRFYQELATNTLTSRGYTLCFHYCVFKGGQLHTWEQCRASTGSGAIGTRVRYFITITIVLTKLGAA